MNKNRKKTANGKWLSVRGIGKRYSQHTILKDISFDIPVGNIVGIVGPNGAGKTTLINIILGFEKQYTGDVRLSGTKRISYIPQLNNKEDQYSLPVSVDEFLHIGANQYFGFGKKINRDELVENLRHVGLDEMHLQRNVHSLSGGEKQRALIARALLSDPLFLVLDEPFASVDYPARDSLYALLRHLNEVHDITILLVSHDVDSVVAICDNVLCLNQTLHTDCYPVEFIQTVQRVHAIEHKCHD